jgi:hypothetical protein
VAREVIERYADDERPRHAQSGRHGTLRLKEWQPGRRLVLEANPHYRERRGPRTRRLRETSGSGRSSHRCAASACRRSDASKCRSSRKPIRGCSCSPRASST